MDLFSECQTATTLWPSTASEFQSPTYEFEWFSACATAFHDDSSRRLISIINDDGLQATAPLFATKKRGITWHEIMGVSKLNEPGGLIYSDKDTLIRLCKLILSNGKPTLLGRLPENDLAIRVFEKTAGKRGMILKVPNTGSPYTEIESSWDDYFNKVSSRRRQDFRRARRRLNDHGLVSVDFLSPSREELDQLLEEAFQVEQANWKGRNKSAINCRPDLKRFFIAYSRNLFDSGKFIIGSLRLDGKMIAVQLLVEHSKRWWVLKIGYDERWSKYSPGMQLMFEALKEAFYRKLDAFEFLGSDEDWINIWPHKTHRFVSLVYFPYNFSGMTALIAEASSKYSSRLWSALTSRNKT
jgi:CelD/BcsL family acetyltransferase involved in cellulose biosynthesis